MHDSIASKCLHTANSACGKVGNSRHHGHFSPQTNLKWERKPGGFLTRVLTVFATGLGIELTMSGIFTFFSTD